MRKKLTKQDICILKTFIKNDIPYYIKEGVIGKWDLMSCYEELFNYSESLICGCKIDFKRNSFGTGEVFIFKQEYKKILFDISNNSDDFDLRVHCCLGLAVLAILEKYSKEK